MLYWGYNNHKDLVHGLLEMKTKQTVSFVITSSIPYLDMKAVSGIITLKKTSLATSSVFSTWLVTRVEAYLDHCRIQERLRSNKLGPWYVLKLSILMVQRLVFHQNRVEFRQQFSDAIRTSLTATYNDIKRRTGRQAGWGQTKTPQATLLTT